MRRLALYTLCGALFFAVPLASAGNFAPTPLKINAPPVFGLGFESSAKIPVTVSGGPAAVVLAIFDSGQASRVQNVRNGHLGWHYVNWIDTCIYVSPQYRLPSGNSTIEWNGRDKNDYPFAWREYTYYLWACADSIPVKKAFHFPSSSPFDRSTLQLYDEQGKPLSSPVFYSAAQPLASSGETWNTRARWVIGGDPEDASLTETTRYQSQPDWGRMAPDPQDSRLFISQTVESGALTTRKWLWTANGDALLRTNWGESGVAVFPSSIATVTDLYSGPVSFRDYLISFVVIGQESTRQVKFLYLDSQDGSPVADRDLGSYRITEAPGLAWNYESILVSLPEAALYQIIDPYTEDMERSIRWGNGPGDGFGDTLPTPGGPHGAALDTYGFALIVENMPNDSFGLLAPDGTGAGYFPIPGLNGGQVQGMQIIDTDSPYDGLYYCSGNSSDVQYTGYDVFKGRFQFAPEMWFPFIHVLGPYRGQTLQAGAEYTVIWCGYGYSTIRIEFSADGGATWNLVEQVVPTRTDLVERYTWRVPDVRSSNCMLRTITKADTELSSTSEPFTISGPSAVADESMPHTLIAVSNSPNPFNPATLIRYNLGLPGRATLTVYNALGQQVRRVDLGQKGGGVHEYLFDGAGLTSGVYFYRVNTEHAVATGRMLLMR